MNLYKIQMVSSNSFAQYVLAKNIIEAIEVWKIKMQAKTDPEVVERVSDNIYEKDK